MEVHSEMKAQPFVKIEDGKLKLVADVSLLNAKPRIISILGKARMGKSTFLNAIISHITSSNISPFKTQDTLDHCTKGIDSFYLEKENILLLDSQGLAHQNSSHDPSLLLFIYLVSDVVVLNERMMLQNEALKLMEPICTFMTYVDIEDIVKPKLTFRISDGDMIKDPVENIKTVMQHYDDQYQSIRDSICHLFQDELHLVKTDTLDKRARQLLSVGDYQGLLKGTDLGFEYAVSHILQYIPNEGTCKVSLGVAIEQINENQKIKIEKLDIVSMTAKTEIRDWLDENVPPSAYSPIEVDGTQAKFEENVEPRKALKKQILSSFTKKFKSVPATLQTPFRTKLEKDLADPILKACERSEILAEERVAPHVTKCKANYTFDISSNNSSITLQKESRSQHILQDFLILEKSAQAVYKPIQEKYISWVERVKGECEEFLQAICDEEAMMKKQITEKLLENIETLEQNLLEDVESILTSEDILQGTSSEELKTLLKLYYKECIEEVLQIWKCHDILCSRAVGGKISYQKTQHPLSDSILRVKSYDMLDKLNESFQNSVMANQTNKTLLSAIVEKKKKILFGKYLIPGMFTKKICSVNSDIDFVNVTKICDNTNLGGDLRSISYILFGGANTNPMINIHPTMTVETYETYWLPLLHRTKDILVKKGYCKEDSSIVNVYDARQCDEPSTTPAEGYEKVLRELFLNRLKKVFCQSVTEGFEMPSILCDK